jgi:type I restriction enzyme M protein
MTDLDQKQLGKTLWNIADTLRGAMNADDFRDYMLSFLFLRYLSDNYEQAAKKELGADYPVLVAEGREPSGSGEVFHASPDGLRRAAKTGDDRRVQLSVWYGDNPGDVAAFEKQMRRKVHSVIKPDYLWGSIVHLAKTQDGKLLDTLQKGFKFIEEESFSSNFQGLFSEINLGSDKLGRKYDDRDAKLCSIISKIARGMALFSTDVDTLGDAYEYLIGQFAAGSGK